MCCLVLDSHLSRDHKTQANFNKKGRKKKDRGEKLRKENEERKEKKRETEKKEKENEKRKNKEINKRQVCKLFQNLWNMFPWFTTFYGKQSQKQRMVDQSG